ncbi:MAG: TetR/AcrR family transcriptional regulator [Bermanella sp.]
MSRREENKELKREKIIVAAIEIISSQGLDKLTMRYLAEKAGVSSRTPYNLFESKTDILVAIIFDAVKHLKLPAMNTGNQLFLEKLVQFPTLIHQFLANDHDFYRDVLWGIMSSDTKLSRDAATSSITGIMSVLVTNAAKQKECSDKIKVEVLSAHLITQFLAILGMWGGSQLALDQAIANIQFSWTNTLLPYSTRKSKTWLSQAQEAYGQALERFLTEEPL